MSGTERIEIRLAGAGDVEAVHRIYQAVHTMEESGQAVIGWRRDTYPVRETARAAQVRGELYVLTADGRVAAAGIINSVQMDAYASIAWSVPAGAQEVLVLHTLVVDPGFSHRGYAHRFVRFYEALAARLGKTALRMDTNAKNLAARRLYADLGYREAGVVPCTFQGLPDVDLVLLEKRPPARPEPLRTDPFS